MQKRRRVLALSTIARDLRHMRDGKRGRAGRGHVMPFRHVRKFVGNDLHERTDGNLIVESSDIARFHADTAVTRRPADVAFFRSSVNVNAATEGMHILALQSSQPDDPGNDRVPARGVRLQNLAGETAVMKNRALGSVVPDLLSNLKITKRRGHAAPEITNAVFGC